MTKIFPNLIKNYKPEVLKPTNDQERLLYNIQTICFAAHDLNLYLDLNPNDQSIPTKPDKLNLVGDVLRTGDGELTYHTLRV